jgi:hypothetical protein
VALVPNQITPNREDPTAQIGAAAVGSEALKEHQERFLHAFRGIVSRQTHREKYRYNGW